MGKGAMGKGAATLRIRLGDMRDGAVRRRCGIARGGEGGGTHNKERKRAARGNRDVARSPGEVDECGGHPGGEVNAAEAVVVSILRCSTWEGTY